MDTFRKAAVDSDLSMVITTGAVYGVFLVFSDSWSEFLKVAIMSVSPSHDDEIVGALIYALSASFICIMTLFIIVKTNGCMDTTKKNIRCQTNKMQLYLAKRSRKDIAQSR